MTGVHRRTPAAPYAVLTSIWLIGSAAIVWQSRAVWDDAGAHGLPAGVLAATLILVTLAEVVGLFFLLGFLAKACAYLGMSDPERAPRSATTPPVAVLYLTAGDFDPVAVDSLLRLEGPGPRLFVLHDDGNDEVVRRRMAEFIDRHPRRPEWEALVWHRPERRGGKAGAVNWVLERLDPSWQLLLLCDSDSIALDLDALAAASTEFDDPGVAVVQFRNVGHVDAQEGRVQRRLATAIDVFDAFAAPQARWGYLPFFGHNALVRCRDLRALGGLTPGFFSDDLDFSIRLTLRGRRIVYRSDIRFGERHPADWNAFRKRARKWAFGCMQVVRARLGAVLVTPGIPFAQRLGMLEFMGFYPAQALLLAGLLAADLVLPWLPGARPSGSAAAVAGLGVTLALLAPTLAWALRRRRLYDWPAFAWACVLVYGGSILSTARGVLDGLSGRERPWIPTNLGGRPRGVPVSVWLECALGLALFVVPWLARDAAVASAASYLFVSTFLFAPLTHRAYRAADAPPPMARAVRHRRSAARAVLLLALAVLPSGAARAAPPPRITVRGSELWAGGTPFQVRGVHYSPWLPGTGPDGRSPYPGRSRVDADLQSIRSLGANTVMLSNAPAWVADLAWSKGLRSIYEFNITWNDTTRAAFEGQGEKILAAVDSLRSAPGLFAWVLGNEIPAWVVDTVGATGVERRLRWLADRVRARDPGHLVGHGNWPPTQALDLSFLDLACFNLYPTWPYEVVVRGYGPYLREVLVPAARGRPLLVTEFGINSLEAGQARQAQVIGDCWREIERSPTVGGVLFEWCDEWWKNYDNPVPGKGYWVRQYDPDDAAREDPDPEEHYGIVKADRTPKLAFAAAKRMWNTRARRPAWWPWATLAGLGLLTGWAYTSGRGAAQGEAAPGS